MRRTAATLRVLLALLLAFAPLLGPAQPMSMEAPAAGNMSPAVDAHTAMPCHAAADTPLQHADVPHAGCPHCAGDAPASACQCCGQVAPAGLVALVPGAPDAPAETGLLPPMVTDALPASPSGRLFRPPI